MLKEDEKFRYAVAGLIGLEEILKRLDRHEEEIRRIWQEIERLREDGNYKLMVIVRNDRYEVDEENRAIHLKDFKLALKFKGKLKWRGKQGRLEIIYNEARRSWYAYIPMEVESNAKPEGGMRASVDLGIVNLATVYVKDGSWYVFKGGSILSR
jgi:putative transposase